MKFAEITCLTRMVRIPDLDLNLFKGDTALVPEEAAEASSDLTLMRRLNAVRVRWIRRCIPKPAVLPIPVQPNLEVVPQPVKADFVVGVDLELLAERLATRPRPKAGSEKPPVNSVVSKKNRTDR